MAVKIQIKRGTKSQLDAYGALEVGELVFLTDEKKVYVGDGSNPNNYLVGAVVSGTGNPSGPGLPGTVYVDTSASGIWFCQDGGSYIEVGNTITDLSQLTGTLDDIADGVNYQRVAASEVDSNGYILQLNDGSFVVTVSGAYNHINNSDLHRVINDLGISSIELWSSQKISDSISAVVNGVDWQESVLDKDLCTPPGSPSDGDRYIVCGTTASGDWAGYENLVVEYITSSGGWVPMPQTEGQAAWVEDEDKIFIWNGSSWIGLSNIANHNNLSGLQGGTTNEYYHLTNSDYVALTTNLNETIEDIIAAVVTGGTNITVSHNDGAGTVTINMDDHGHTGVGDGGLISHGSLTNIGADDHHNQQHSITSAADHTVTAASGQVLATIADNILGMTQIDGSMMGNVNHNDLQNIGEDDHHNRQHSWLSSADHTFGPWTVGNLFQVATGGASVETTGTVDGGTLT